MVVGVNNISKSFGNTVVLEDLSFQIKAGEKVGLVGRNGSGKTTLIRMILGELEPDSGSVTCGADTRIAVLGQHLEHLEGTIWERASLPFQTEFDAAQRIKELERKLDDGDQTLVDEYSDLVQTLSERPVQALEARVRTALEEQGLDEARFHESLSSLSGGERTRVELARLSLEQSDLLILDEPTNHLDLFGIEDLAKWVRRYKGAVLAVSHNRDFLDKTCEKFLDLRERTVRSYPGPLENYLSLRADYDAERLRIAKAKSKREAELDSFVRRFINSQRTAQAKGRRRLLERLKSEQMSTPELEREMMPVFEQARRSSEIVLEAKQFSVGYSEPLIKPFDWTVRESERWAIVGANGSGKTTLIQSLLSRLSQMSGSVRLGPSVDLAVFDQTPLKGDMSLTALDYIVSQTDLDRPGARGLLGRFLFSDDDVFKPVASLSGGERNKLAFAIIARSKPNLLILDEPTNHMDFESRTVLVDALQDYQGSIIVVSHDSFFLSELTEHCLILRDGMAEIELSPFRELSIDDLRSKNRPSREPIFESDSAEARLSHREISKAIVSKRQIIEDLESQIAELEAQAQEIESQLAKPDEVDDLQSAIETHQSKKSEIEVAIATWQSESESLAELERLQG